MRGSFLFLPKSFFCGINRRLRFSDFAFERFDLDLKVLAASIKLVVGNPIWNGPSEHRQTNDPIKMLWANR